MIFLSRKRLHRMIDRAIDNKLSALKRQQYRISTYGITGGRSTIIELDYYDHGYSYGGPVAKSEPMDLTELLNTIIRAAGITLAVEPAKSAVVTATCNKSDKEPQ